MKVLCSQRSLTKGISLVSKAVPSRAVVSIISHVLLEAKDNQLRLCATNMELSINCWIPASVEVEGAVTVPAKLLQDFVQTLPDDEVRIAFNEKNNTLQVQCARIDAKFKTMAANDFPLIPTLSSFLLKENSEDEAQKGYHIGLDNNSFRTMIKQTTFAASKDMHRPTLTGLCAIFNKDAFTLVATDGYRLSRRMIPVEAHDALLPENPVVIPAKTLDEVARICADGSDEEQVIAYMPSTDTRQIVFHIKAGESSKNLFESVEVVSQLIDGKFPQYEAIIPKSHTTSMVVETKAMQKAIKVSALFAKDNANLVKLTVDPAHGQYGQLRVFGFNSESGDSMNEIDAAVSQGETVEISFNADYLMDVLSNITSETVILEMTQSSKPITIRPYENAPSVFLYVVMPMMRRDT